MKADIGPVIFAAANFGIFLGYIFLAVAVAPNFEVTLKRTKWGGVAFFLLCGLTHLEMAYHTLTDTSMLIDLDWHMYAIHIPQVIAVWLFVWGLYLELVKGRGVWPLATSPRIKDRKRS